MGRRQCESRRLSPMVFIRLEFSENGSLPILPQGGTKFNDTICAGMEIKMIMQRERKIDTQRGITDMSRLLFTFSYQGKLYGITEETELLTDRLVCQRIRWNPVFGTYYMGCRRDDPALLVADRILGHISCAPQGKFNGEHYEYTERKNDGKVKYRIRKCKRHVFLSPICERIPYMLCALFCVVAVCMAFTVLGGMGKDIAREEDRPEQAPDIMDAAQIAENYETALIKIEEGIWLTLDESDKLAVLQSICDYESTVTLGCGVLKIGTEDVEQDNLHGYYRHCDREIIFNRSHLLASKAEDVIVTLMHELRHAWQATVADMYISVKGSLDAAYLNLSIYRQAETFHYEMTHYTDHEVNFDLYYAQEIEKDSREWADRMLYQKYFSLIYKISA